MRALLAAVCLGLLLGCDCIGSYPADAGAGGGGASTGGGSAGGTATGGGGLGGGSSADAGPSIADFCARYPAAICAVKTACGAYSDAGYDACLANERRLLADPCGRAEVGALHYSAALAQACLDETALSPTPCGVLAEFGCGINVYFNASPFSVDLNACGAATCSPDTLCDRDCSNPQCRPARQVGQSCEESSRPAAPCDTDAGFCRADDGGFGGPTGQCRPFAGAGMPCPDGYCVPGQTCAFGMCQAIGGRDAPCMTFSDCFDSVCRPSDHRCGALDAGSACTSSNDCSFPLDLSYLCVGLTYAPDGGIADAGVCAPRPKHGEPCSVDWAPFSNGACPPGDACLDGQCRTLTPFTAPAGSECPTRPYGITTAPYFGFAYCQAGLVCQPAAAAHPTFSGRCAAPLPLGAPCLEDLECASLACGALDGGFFLPYECLPRAGLNEPCGQCLSELTCVRNDAGTSTCVQPVPAGGNCTPFAQCASGYCTYPDFTCHAFSTGACSHDDECESGWCASGQCVPIGTCRAPY